MKKILIILILTILFFSLPKKIEAGVYQAHSESVYYQGLVPCGKEVCVGAILNENEIKTNGFNQACTTTGGRVETIYCQFCHFFVMLDGIIDFLLIKIVPYLAILMIVIGGIIFYFSRGRPTLLGKGKELLTGVVIGLFLIYGAYMIVGVFLSILGVTEWSGLIEWTTKGAFSLRCEIELPPPP